MSGGSWSSYDTAACRGVTRHELRLSDNKALVYEDGQIVCWNRGLLTCGDECQPWFRDARAARLHVKTKHGWSTAGLEKQLSAYNMAEVVHDMEGRPMPGRQFWRERCVFILEEGPKVSLERKDGYVRPEGCLIESLKPTPENTHRFGCTDHVGVDSRRHHSLRPATPCPSSSFVAGRCLARSRSPSAMSSCWAPPIQQLAPAASRGRLGVRRETQIGKRPRREASQPIQRLTEEEDETTAEEGGDDEEEEEEEEASGAVSAPTHRCAWKKSADKCSRKVAVCGDFCSEHACPDLTCFRGADCPEHVCTCGKPSRVDVGAEDELPPDTKACCKGHACIWLDHDNEPCAASSMNGLCEAHAAMEVCVSKLFRQVGVTSQFDNFLGAADVLKALPEGHEACLKDTQTAHQQEVLSLQQQLDGVRTAHQQEVSGLQQQLDGFRSTIGVQAQQLLEKQGELLELRREMDGIRATSSAQAQQLLDEKAAHVEKMQGMQTMLNDGVAQQNEEVSKLRHDLREARQRVAENGQAEDETCGAQEELQALVSGVNKAACAVVDWVKRFARPTYTEEVEAGDSKTYVDLAAEYQKKKTLLESIMASARADAPQCPKAFRMIGKTVRQITSWRDEVVESYEVTFNQENVAKAQQELQESKQNGEKACLQAFDKLTMSANVLNHQVQSGYRTMRVEKEKAEGIVQEGQKALHERKRMQELIDDLSVMDKPFWNNELSGAALGSS